MSRKKLFFAFMAIFLVVTQLASYIPVDPNEAEELLEYFMSQLPDVEPIDIALHNLTIATIMFIPGAGAVIGIIVGAQTGFAFGVANAVSTLEFDIPPALVLAVTPFGIMEWVAYSLAMSRSYMLIRKIKKRKELKAMFKPTIIEYCIVAALLVAGGFTEAWIIENMTTIAEMVGIEM